MADAKFKHALLTALRGRGAHEPHASILARIPAARATDIPPWSSHSAYQLVEHMRACMDDIIDYCKNAHYAGHDFNSDFFWPANPESLSEDKWEKCRAAYFRSLNEMIALVENEPLDLLAPSGPDDHTLFREALIVVDHNSYHCGQLTLLARYMQS